MPSSILSRKRDIPYLVFFITHIPIIFLVDLTTLYPPAFFSAFPVLSTIRTFYISSYRDPLFLAPQPWFKAFLWLEAFYHVPLSVWAVGALLRDDDNVPLQLLVFAVETAVSTLACLAEVAGSDAPGFERHHRLSLIPMYSVYLGLAVYMSVDMIARLRARLGVARIHAKVS